MREELSLESLRSNLIRQEETIIFSLIERAQFKVNSIIYKNDGIKIENYHGSFMTYLLLETERVHSKVRRFTAPDEHPFNKELETPLLTPMKYDWPIKKTSININDKILSLYIDKIIPLVCKNGDDGNYGSASVCDVAVLQSISKRIHYGKFIAESKYQKEKDIYNKLIKEHKTDEMMALLTDAAVEEKVLERVKVKTITYGQEPLSENPDYKIDPEVMKGIYKDFVIPLTKEVEIMYLLERLGE